MLYSCLYGGFYICEKKKMYRFLVVFFVFIVVISCDSDVDEGKFIVGSDYLSVTNKVLLLDTLTVELSTIQLDSLITSNTSRILVGNYLDPLFGNVVSESYFQLTPTSYTIEDATSDTNAPNYVFDSIAMILKYDRYYYGDTTKVQNLSVHQLTQKVKPVSIDNSVTSFYNKSKLKYESQSLGALAYRPRPIGRDSLNIRLSDSFGSALFLKLQKKEITDVNELIDYFKGIVIKSGSSSSNCMVGFGTSSVIRMYYSDSKSKIEEKSLYRDFAIADLNKQFNAIQSDRTGTLIENLPTSRYNLPSVNIFNQSFTQSGTGVMSRVSFPNLKQLQYIAAKGSIIKAELFIRPVKNSYSKSFPLADSLQVYTSDNLNRITSRLYGNDGNPVYGILNTKEDEFNESIGYTIPIGDFLRKEVLKLTETKASLLLALPSFDKGVNRVVFGDQSNKESKLQVKIYYITY